MEHSGGGTQTRLHSAESSYLSCLRSIWSPGQGWLEQVVLTVESGKYSSRALAGKDTKNILWLAASIGFGWKSTIKGIICSPCFSLRGYFNQSLSISPFVALVFSSMVIVSFEFSYIHFVSWLFQLMGAQYITADGTIWLSTGCQDSISVQLLNYSDYLMTYSWVQALHSSLCAWHYLNLIVAMLLRGTEGLHNMWYVSFVS